MVTNANTRRQPESPSRGGAAQRQLDVLVVEEEALVESADIAHERRPQQHCATGEHVDLGRRSIDGRNRLVAPSIRPSAVSIDLDTCTVHEIPGRRHEERLHRADRRIGELRHESLAPARLDLDVVVQHDDSVVTIIDRSRDPDVRRRTESVVVGRHHLDPFEQRGAFASIRAQPGRGLTAVVDDENQRGAACLDHRLDGAFEETWR